MNPPHRVGRTVISSHTGRWPLGANPDDHQWTGFSVRSQQFRLVGDALFDMQADPGQTTNVIDQHAETAAAMKAAFAKFWQEARPLMVNEGVPQSPTRPFWKAFEAQQKTLAVGPFSRSVSALPR